MRAAVVTAFGPPEVIRPMPVPEPDLDRDQALIEVELSDVGHVETQIRQGLAEWFPLSPPFIGGQSFVGRVLAVGGSLGHNLVDRRVVALAPGGGHAERAAASIDHLLPLPDEVNSEAAVAATHDGQTALSLWRTMPAQPGETVLITGAAGGMGLLLVQLLVSRGVRVLGTARGPAKLAAVKAAGALPIDYSQPDWPDRVRHHAPRGVEVAYDGVGGPIGQTALGLVKDGGRMSAHGFASGAAGPEHAERDIHLQHIDRLQNDMATSLREIATCIAAFRDGSLRPRIDRIVPLDGVAELHRALESRQIIGKALVGPSS